MSVVQVQERNKDLSNFKLRKSGVIPAVYFRKGEESVNLQLTLSEFVKSVKGKDGILSLSNGKMAIVKEIQVQPETGKVIHVSLQGVVQGEKFSQEVHIHLVQPEKPNWGSDVRVSQELETLTLETTPDKMPKRLIVDITNLTEDDKILVKDLAIPEGVKVLDNPDTLIVHLVHNKVQEEETSTEESPPEAPTEEIKE